MLTHAIDDLDDPDDPAARRCNEPKSYRHLQCCEIVGVITYEGEENTYTISMRTA
jgi:hypothetical protein